MKSKGIFRILLVSVATLAAACNSQSGAAPVAPAGVGTRAPAAAPVPPPGSPPAPSQPTPFIPASNVIDVQTGEESYLFTPDALNLKLGQTYQIRVKGGTEIHTFTTPDFGVNTVVQPGETVAITLTATKAGTFTFVCSPHEGLGMKGTITVTP